MGKLEYLHFDKEYVESDILKEFSQEAVDTVRNFHKSFKEYEPTPLVELKDLAAHIGVKNIFVKDESHRFNLNAFKVLGGSFAVAKYVADKLNVDINTVDYNWLTSEDVKKQLEGLTIVTATDGNHGRGIAWTARELGMRAKVFMPKGSTQARADHIENLGSEVEITEWNYDDTRRHAVRIAEENNWPIIQDTTWDGHEEIPLWTMQGYTTMATEAREQLQELGTKKPSHLFLQAGAGSFAGAMSGYFTEYYKEDLINTTVIEPATANGLFKTAEQNNGELYFATGDLKTIMAGLSVGEPCTVGWDVLGKYANNFISCEDSFAAKGCRVLSNPIGNDERIVSGESGSVGIGVLVELMTNPTYTQAKEVLKLDEYSEVLIFSTEGDTDKEVYRKVVWDGYCPSGNL